MRLIRHRLWKIYEDQLDAYRDYRWEKEEEDFDRRFNVDTCYSEDEDRIETNDSDIYFDYDPVKVSTFTKAIQSLKIRYEDFTFIDIGSGKGRALLMATSYPFKEIIGVEMFPYFKEIAERNIADYRNAEQKCFNIKIENFEATTYPLPEEKTVCFLFNPFNDEVLLKFLSNIKNSLSNSPREIFLIYLHPEYPEPLENADFLTLLKEEEGYDEYTFFRIYRCKW
jgi:16S rRNA G966 N2-methylase RsmD